MNFRRPAQSFDNTGAFIASLPTDAKMEADFGHLVSASDGVDDPREDVETKKVTIEAWIRHYCKTIIVTLFAEAIATVTQLWKKS